MLVCVSTPLTHLFSHENLLPSQMRSRPKHHHYAGSPLFSPPTPVRTVSWCKPLDSYMIYWLTCWFVFSTTLTHPFSHENLLPAKWSPGQKGHQHVNRYINSWNDPRRSGVEKLVTLHSDDLFGPGLSFWLGSSFHVKMDEFRVVETQYQHVNQ